LQDAEKAIHISPAWAKGYFRKGRALSGLKVKSVFYLQNNLAFLCCRREFETICEYFKKLFVKIDPIWMIP